MAATSAATAGHRLLIRPTIFNIPVTFKPLYRFIQKVEEHYIARQEKKSEIRAFLDDYLLRFFLPQVEDAAVTRFRECVNGTL